MTKKLHKTLYVMLALSLSVILLLGNVITAFAAPNTEITEINVTVEIPKACQTDSTVIWSVPAGSNYTVSPESTLWFDAFGGVNASPFMDGNEYITPTFTVTPNTGYTIASDAIVYVNGSRDFVSLLGDGNCPAAMFEFRTTPQILGYINRVELTGLPTATLGEAAADYNFTNATEHYKAQGIWHKYNYTTSTYEPMSVGEVFEAGKIYQLNVCISSSEAGYILSYITSFTVDSEYVSANFIDANAYIEEYYNFGEPIENLKISKSDLPKAELGKTFTNDKITIPTNNENVVAEGYWYTDDGNGMVCSGTFEAGKEYWLDIEIRAKQGYSFNENDPIMIGDDVTCSYNRISANYTERYSFRPVIENVVLNLPEIKVGDTLKTGEVNIDLPDDAKYYTSAIWYEYDDENNMYTPLSQNTIVEKGKSYRLDVPLYTKDGYDFAEPAYLTVNGVKYKSNSNSYNYIPYEKNYSFRDVIDKVELTGYKEPAIGDTASVDGIKIPDNANYTISDLSWLDMDTGEPITSFEKGKAYYLWCEITAKKGYEFSNKASVLLDGEKIDAYTEGTTIRLSKEISFKEVLKELHVDSLPTMKVGELPSTEVKLPNGAKYGADVFWTVWNDDTESYEDFTGAFEAGKIYRLEAYFHPNDGYEFSADETVCYLGGQPSDKFEVYGWNVGYTEDFHEGFKTIDRIEIKIDKPVIGNHSSVSPIITLPDGANYKLNNNGMPLGWLMGNVDEYDWLEDDIFIADENYGVSFNLSAAEGYVFSDDVVVIVNDKVVTKAIKDGNNLKTAKTYSISYFFDMKCEHLFDDEKDSKCDICGYEKPKEDDTAVKDQSATNESSTNEAEKQPEKSPATGDSALQLSLSIIIALCSATLFICSKKASRV